METPEEEPVSRVTYLIRIMEKHINKMSKALDDLEKSGLPNNYLSDDNSGTDDQQDKKGETDEPAPKS